MRAVPIIAMLAGLAIVGALIAAFGTQGLIHSFVALGWKGFVAICLIHLGLIAVMGIAWRALVADARMRTFLAARIVREAGSEVLPLSPIGGCVLGARVLTLGGVAGSIAAASTIVDLTLEFLAKLAYTALGLVLLISLRHDWAVAIPVGLGLAVASLAAVGLVAAQRHGFTLFDRFARRLGSGWAERTAAGAAALHEALRSSYQRRGGIWAGFFLHLFCWIAATVEAWFALQLVGSGLSFETVLVIESLVYAIRTFAIVIPNAVGLQEGAYVLIAAGFGLPPPVALMLSLVKRARDLAIGAPALAVWQWVEGRRLWRKQREPMAPQAEPAAPRRSWTGADDG